ncbi:MAG: PEP-CTERM sorting domain-containing protein [Telluria sp.]
MTKFIKALFIVTLLASAGAQAMTVRGTGSGALIGGDLTDPVNPLSGLAEGALTYNATFRSSIEPGFEGNENAFNVFDNKVGGGNDKWCCDLNVWVEANFGTKQFTLTKFTATSGNDVWERDSDQWQILGSNDGINYTSIFAYSIDGVSPWGQNRHQVNEYSAGVDFALPAAYSIFRYQSTSVVAGGMHQLNELEFFGNPIPEPAAPAIMGLGLAGLAFFRRRKKA